MSSQFLQPSYKTGFARSAGESAMPGLWRGLTSLWAPPLGPTGLAVHDWACRSNNGALTNMDIATAWVITPPYGHTIDLDGSNDYIVKETPARMPSGASPRTIACLFKFDTIKQQMVYGYGTNANNQNFQVGTESASGDWRVYVWGVFDWSTGVSDTDTANSHMAVVTYDGTTVQFAWDGEIRGSIGRSLNTTPTRIVSGVEIDLTGRQMDGQLALGATWSRVLTAKEIAVLYADPLGLLRKRGFVAKAGGAPPAAGAHRPLALMGVG